jgi:hypothetical protein
VHLVGSTIGIPVCSSVSTSDLLPNFVLDSFRRLRRGAAGNDSINTPELSAASTFIYLFSEVLEA